MASYATEGKEIDPAGTHGEEMFLDFPAQQSLRISEKPLSVPAPTPHQPKACIDQIAEVEQSR